MYVYIYKCMYINIRMAWIECDDIVESYPALGESIIDHIDK
jgi:hypothetical protein